MAHGEADEGFWSSRQIACMGNTVETVIETNTDESFHVIDWSGIWNIAG
jgi:hypothetical protein